MAFRDVAITGNSGTVPSSGTWEIEPGDSQDQVIHVYGTWDSATVTLQYGLDGTNFDDVAKSVSDATAVTLTADGHFYVGPNTGYVQLIWSGGAGSVSLTVDANGIKANA